MSMHSVAKKYEWVLFDADETLFHFDACRGLQTMFAQFGIQFSVSDYAAYQVVNKQLWQRYQEHQITAGELQQLRFTSWAERLSTTPSALNQAFLHAMAEISTPLDGVPELLQTLHGNIRMGIITNGFTQLQRIRLERTGLHHYFEVLVVSEEVGIAKPGRQIFDYALEQMGQPARSAVLMVGDTLESDILGGIQAGLDTCWLNPAQKTAIPGIAPTFEVANHHTLKTLLTA
ncbi:pyrimidine 5'-nucleotidase [Undibacterium rugosum]|uniref:pyrimidine 5'-nucleotidase n=1 Tax=Undibacterium rugosum TaxID=2762291 RepID=UPI001B83E377|nr:pyrimidine 5'-nucleotidase [Undibacterium rugosum]MBR7780171.1 pyrimidine 5'-nucleotidase [Undibacterium rugosum]